MTPPRPDCNHPTTRFTTIGGEEGCETCARLDAKWTECRSIHCDNLTPPDERRCHTHYVDGMAECPDCKGEGETDCAELDCHGEFCEGGIVLCDLCGGDGEVEKEVVAA